MSNLDRDSKIFFLVDVHNVAPRDRDAIRRNFEKLTDSEIDEHYRKFLDRWWFFDEWRERRTIKPTIKRIVELAEVPESDKDFVAEKLLRCSRTEIERQLALLQRYS